MQNFGIRKLPWSSASTKKKERQEARRDWGEWSSRGSASTFEQKDERNLERRKERNKKKEKT